MREHSSCPSEKTGVIRTQCVLYLYISMNAKGVRRYGKRKKSKITTNVLHHSVYQEHKVMTSYVACGWIPNTFRPQSHVTLHNWDRRCRNGMNHDELPGHAGVNLSACALARDLLYIWLVSYSPQHVRVSTRTEYWGTMSSTYSIQGMLEYPNMK